MRFLILFALAGAMTACSGSSNETTATPEDETYTTAGDEDTAQEPAAAENDDEIVGPSD